MLRTSTKILAPVREKVEAGERLTLDDGVLLYSNDVPLPELGRRCQEKSEIVQLHGPEVRRDLDANNKPADWVALLASIYSIMA